MNTLQYEERDFTVISLKYTQPHKKDECQIEEIAALRIRDGHTVNTWTALVRESSENNTCLSAAESDSESSFKQLLRQFLEFIGTDIIVTYQADTVIPLINNECRRLSLPSLSGTYIDILPMAEKVLPRQRRYDLSVLADHFQITPPDGRTISECWTIFPLYMRLSACLYRQRREWPIWMPALSESQYQYMEKALPRKIKKTFRCYLCWGFSVHYFYLKRPLLNLLYWCSLGGLGLWFFIDLFRIPFLIDQYNEKISMETLNEAKQLFPVSENPAAPPSADPDLSLSSLHRSGRPLQNGSFPPTA